MDFAFWQRQPVRIHIPLSLVDLSITSPGKRPGSHIFLEKSKERIKTLLCRIRKVSIACRINIQEQYG